MKKIPTWVKALITVITLLIAITAISSVVMNSWNSQPSFITVRKLITTETPLITLQPGESKVVKTFDEETGRRYTYTAKWVTYSPDSWLQTYNHGFRGEDGDDRLVGCRVYPARGTSFANSGRLKNRDTYYISIRNDGPDVVSFIVKLHDEVSYKKPIVAEQKAEKE